MRRLFSTLILILILAGCGEASNPTTVPVQPTTAAAAAPTEKPTVAAAPTEKPTEKPTVAAPTEKPTVAATETAPAATAPAGKTGDGVTINASGFGQAEKEVMYAFTVTNGSATSAAESFEYQATAYDKAGTVIKTDSGYVNMLVPGETSGVVSSMYLDAETTIDKVEITLSEGDMTPVSAPVSPFKTDKIAYVADDYFPRIVGMVQNPYEQDVTDVEVAAIAYDEAGKIIGGGFTYIAYIPKNAQAAAALGVTTKDKPAKIELYANLTSLSLVGNDDAAEKPLTVTSNGFGQDGTSLGYGFVVKNPSTSESVEDSVYRVEFYAADGSILGVDEGNISVVLPDQELGIGGTLSVIGEEKAVDKLVVLFRSGKGAKDATKPTFTTDKATFVGGDYSSNITGVIKSTHSKEVKDLRVYAIAYDEAGAIIGGGSTFADAPANGESPVEVSVTVGAKPAKVALYATLSALSEP